jgi:hypothetical protein
VRAAIDKPYRLGLDEVEVKVLQFIMAFEEAQDAIELEKSLRW